MPPFKKNSQYRNLQHDACIVEIKNLPLNTDALSYISHNQRTCQKFMNQLTVNILYRGDDRFFRDLIGFHSVDVYVCNPSSS